MRRQCEKCGEFFPPGYRKCVGCKEHIIRFVIPLSTAVTLILIASFIAVYDLLMYGNLSALFPAAHR